MNYDIVQHRHYLALWAAARASQRGVKGATVGLFEQALNKCGVIEFLGSSKSTDIDNESFNRLHSEWCRNLISCLQPDINGKATYGRAAKFLNMYLKVAVVIASPESRLSHVIHPPIDRILLQAMARSDEITHSKKRSWRYINWTELDKASYFNLIAELRSIIPPREPLWTIERYWRPTA